MIEATAIQDQIYKLGNRAAIPKDLLLLRTVSVGDGTPHLELKNGEFHYVIAERGLEFSRRKTTDLDNFLYWFFEAICSRFSFEYELHHRIVGQDQRRIAFAKRIELMNLINPTWAAKAQDDISSILVSSPYNDDV
ncbi:Imm63 family immunity protein [Ralstonia pseudosolanacearum]